MFGFHQLDLDLPVLSVSLCSGRCVGQAGNASQFLVNQVEGVVQLLSRVWEKGSSPGLLREFLENLLSPLVTAGSNPIGSDRIDRDVVLLDHVQGFFGGMSAVQISPVGNDDDRIAPLRDVQLVACHDEDRIEERGSATRLQSFQLAGDLSGLICEIGDEGDAGVELGHHRLVSRLHH